MKRLLWIPAIALLIGAPALLWSRSRPKPPPAIVLELTPAPWNHGDRWPIEARLRNAGSEPALVLSNAQNFQHMRLEVFDEHGSPLPPEPHGNLCCDVLIDPHKGEFEDLAPGARSSVQNGCYLRSVRPRPGVYRVRVTYEARIPDLPVLWRWSDWSYLSGDVVPYLREAFRGTLSAEIRVER